MFLVAVSQALQVQLFSTGLGTRARHGVDDLGHSTGGLYDSNYEARRMGVLLILLALVVGRTIVGEAGRTPEQQLTGLFPKHSSRFCPFCTHLIMSSITSSFRTSPKACIGIELGVLVGLSNWRPVSGIASAGMLRGELRAQVEGKEGCCLA